MKDHGISVIRRWLSGFLQKHVHGMITCRQFDSFVLAYLDGELPAHQRLLFERHIKFCRQCQEYLAAYQRTVKLGRAVFPSPDEILPEAVPKI